MPLIAPCWSLLRVPSRSKSQQCRACTQRWEVSGKMLGVTRRWGGQEEAALGFKAVPTGHVVNESS